MASLNSEAEEQMRQKEAAERRRILGKKLAGIAAIYVLEKAVAKGLVQAKLKVPSSLATMLLWLGGLKALELSGEKERAEAIASALQPAVGFLGKWMTLFLTPPLTMLPVAIKTHAKGTSAAQWRKLAAIHACGWALSCVLSAAIAHALAVKAEKKPALEESSQKVASDSTSASGADTKPVAAAPKTAPLVDPLLANWLKLTLAAYCLSPTVGRKPAAVGTTVSAIIAAGTLLPKAVTKVAHPVVVAAATTAVSLVMSAQATGTPVDDAFAGYVNGGGPLAGGAGDLVSALMNAAVSALGIRMFEARRVLEENWQPLLGGAGSAAIFSLFATSWAAGKAELPETLGLALSQRSVMSALGIAGAEALGTSPALAVASILLTGVYGASLGPALLDALGIKAPGPKAGSPENSVTRGVAMGASAHAIGTASLMANEPDAAAVSSVSLCVTGIVHTAILSLPATQAAIKALVAGGPAGPVAAVR